MPGMSAFARVGRLIAKIAAALAVIVFIVVLGSFSANFFDTALTREAKALLAPPPNPYQPEENIYLAMAGLDGASERAISDMGKERIAAYNQAVEDLLPHPEGAMELEQKWRSTGLAF